MNMKSVLKYQIPVKYQVVNVPMEAGDRIVHVGEQRGQVMMWVERKQPEGGAIRPGTDVEVSAQPVRRFIVVGTGQPVYDHWFHCGTAICAGGGLVWHVYEVG